MDHSMNRYIALGVRTDVRALIDKFCEFGTVRYDKFAEVWREMKFSYIYFGRKTCDELIEFTEEVLRIAKEFWLNSEHLDEKVGGLYTLYGLYIKQPTLNIVKIRITVSEMKSIVEFRSVVHSERHHDANCILSKLFYKGAFHFCVTTHVHGLEKNVRRYHEVDRSSLEKHMGSSRNLGNIPVLGMLERAIEAYQESKEKDAVRNRCPFLLGPSNVASTIKEKLRKVSLAPATPRPSLSADELRRREAIQHVPYFEDDSVSEESNRPTKTVQSQSTLPTREVSSNCNEDENQTAGTSKSDKQKQDGSVPNLCTSGEEDPNLQSSSSIILNEMQLRGPENETDNYDEDDDDDDDEYDYGDSYILSAGTSKSEEQKPSMPMLWEEAHISQNPVNITPGIIQEGGSQTDENEEEGGCAEDDSNALNVSDEEQIYKLSLSDMLRSDKEADNIEKNQNAGKSLFDMPAL